jgi:competence protein ComEA
VEELEKKSLFPVNLLTSSSNKKLLAIVLCGLFLIGLGIFFYRSGGIEPSTKVEILSGSTDVSEVEITVDIAGEVVSPGVYKLPGGSRMDDLLVAAGGFSADADRDSIEKYLNRAAKLTDGQKVYIPKVGQQSLGVSAKDTSGEEGQFITSGETLGGSTNINTSSLSELDKLPGIGPVYGQSIIDHRPYSNVDELVSKGAVKQSVYEKIKNLVSVY